MEGQEEKREDGQCPTCDACERSKEEKWFIRDHQEDLADNQNAGA